MTRETTETDVLIAAAMAVHPEGWKERWKNGPCPITSTIDVGSWQPRAWDTDEQASAMLLEMMAAEYFTPQNGLFFAVNACCNALGLDERGKCRAGWCVGVYQEDDENAVQPLWECTDPDRKTAIATAFIAWKGKA